MKIKYLIIILLAPFFAHMAQAQDTIVEPNAQKLFEQARQLQEDYRFDEAVEVYKKVQSLYLVTASMLQDADLQIEACNNAKKTLKQAYSPKIVGRKKVLRNDFLKYFNVIENGCFAPRSQSMIMDADKEHLDKLPLVFFPNAKNKNKDIICFSSYGKYGETGLDIYIIRRIEGNKWSEPQAISENINTKFDETNPFLSEDGKTIYFASNGHQGLGGFDIYKSTYNKDSGTWSSPQNLGFPLSSPADEYMYITDKDNAFACLCSTRDCEKYQINVYKMEVAINPEMHNVSNSAEMDSISQLNIYVEKAPTPEPVEVGVKELAANNDYVAALTAARDYKNKFNDIQKSIDDLRNSMFDADESARPAIEQKIIKKESELFATQATVSELSLQISKMEYQYITKGSAPYLSDSLKQIINARPIKKIEAKKIVDVNFGVPNDSYICATPDVQMTPLQLTDADMFRFSTYGKLIIEHDYPLPQGLVYKIRVGVFSESRVIEQETFRGCSPVTSDLQKGMRRYYIGMFRTYSEAENAMEQLKVLGFKAPAIVAWSNGESITIKEAKNIEEGKTTIKTATKNKDQAATKQIYRVTIGPIADEANISQTIARYADGKDISKRNDEGGKVIYSVGNFASNEQAMDFREKLIANGINNIKIDEIKMNQ